MKRTCALIGLVTLAGVGVFPWGGAIRQWPAITTNGGAEARRSGSAVWAAPAPKAASKIQAALADARKQRKHLFALFIRTGDGNCDKMKVVFAEAERALRARALFRIAAVSDPSESGFIARYGVSRAALPLTLVFAPNGAIVKAFPGKVVSRPELSAAFASPAFAEVMRGAQAGKLVLLCVQGKATRHNKESLAAVRAAASDKKARGSILVVEAAPEDAANAKMLKALNVSAPLKEATVFILAPPSTLAGKVVGATTRQAVLAAIAKGASSCSSGSCGPAG